MVVSFVDIGGIVDHHCLEVVVSFGDIGGLKLRKLRPSYLSGIHKRP